MSLRKVYLMIIAAVILLLVFYKACGAQAHHVILNDGKTIYYCGSDKIECVPYTDSDTVRVYDPEQKHFINPAISEPVEQLMSGSFEEAIHNFPYSCFDQWVGAWMGSNIPCNAKLTPDQIKQYTVQREYERRTKPSDIETRFTNDYPKGLTVLGSHSWMFVYTDENGDTIVTIKVPHVKN